MVFLIYEDYLQRYIEAEKMQHDLMLFQEELFHRTQPKALTYDADRVDGGMYSDKMEEYMYTKEKHNLDQRLLEANKMVEARLSCLKAKEAELRQSKALYDRIYVLRYLEHVRVFLIARKLNYSESQIYRILNKMDKKLKHAKKCEKDSDIIHDEKISK